MWWKGSSSREGGAAGAGGGFDIVVSGSIVHTYFTCATSLVIIPNRFLNFPDDVTRDGS